MEDRTFTISWQRFPALFIFLSLIAGALLFKGIFFPIFIAFTHPKKSFIAGFILLSLFTASLYHFFTTDLPKSGKVIAFVEPISIKDKNKKILLTANIPYLYTEDGNSHHNIPVFISLSSKQLPSMQHKHLVKGMLKKTNYGYFLHPKEWVEDVYSPSLINMRYHLHKKAAQKIKQQVQDKDVQNYFISLVTGSIPSPFLRAKFLDCGMIHLLAISGFHFSWILFLLSIPLTLLLSQKRALLLLLFFAWCYFLFIGNSISISRAWMGTTIYIICILCSKIRLPINSLGLTGIFSMVIDPYSIFHLSFALSFLATFAILTLFPLVKYLTNCLFPKKKGQTLSFMNKTNKMVYFCNRFFACSFFLSFFIQILILPISFLFFPFISLWSLLYNIFFPITMIPTLILLIASFSLLPILPTTLLWKINEYFTKPILETLLYGKGSAFLLIKINATSPELISFITTILVFSCLKIDAFFHEKYLLKLDGIVDHL